MARVDILLPYWGEFSLFKQTVESVLAQTSAEWRLLVFDDCYTTLEAQEYCKLLNEPRITYYRHPKNIGITNNFNHALRAATADYCIMLGCDDRLLPNYLEAALTHIDDVDFYQPAVEVINGQGHCYLPLVDRIKRLLQPRTSGVYYGERLAASMCRGNWLYFPSIMWRTSTIKRYKFDEHYKIAEDLLLELSMIKDGARLYFDKDNATFQYRRFADSLSSREKSKGGVRFDEEDEVYEICAEAFSSIGWHRATRAAKLRLTSRIHHLLS